MHPILFEIGPVTIRSYGVLVALAFFTGFFCLYKEAGRKNFYPEQILDMELYILIFGIIGARALHVAVNAAYYKSHPAEIVMLWRGGLAVYGGLLLGIVAAWVFIKKNRMPFWKSADFIIPYIALGQSIGRIGCYLNGCCFGKYYGGFFMHPTQLYAATALLGIFIVLKFAGKIRLPEGTIFTLYLLLYSTQRFFIDFLRGDTELYIASLTTSQIISVFIFIVAVLLLFFKRKRV